MRLRFCLLLAIAPACWATPWESSARLQRLPKSIAGTLVIAGDGIQFRSPQIGYRWPFVQIQTFDLLTPRRFILVSYQNKRWHLPGDRQFRFDTEDPIPTELAAELTQLVGKPVRNGVFVPEQAARATLAARHRTRLGGSNGTIHVLPDGIDYVTPDGSDARKWRWADIQTVANPDAFHFRVSSFRETYDFELKQQITTDLFDWIWEQVYAGAGR